MRGLYIHIPFCIKKCEYCDFVSFSDCYHKEAAYLSALTEEMKIYRSEAVDTVYIGGGTPTSLTTQGLEFLMENIFRYFDVADDAEITMECNPGTCNLEKLKALRTAGVNRLSIGVQSFNDAELSTIGRIHNAADAIACAVDAKFAGFKNISLDIMFGLPLQTTETLRYTLIKAFSAGVNHISCYSLILEEGTPLFERVRTRQLYLPSEDAEVQMYNVACDMLEKSGYHQYEISNFARSGFESRHNLKYWDCTEYIGCGCAAHSYYNNQRYTNTTDLDEYIASPLKKYDVTGLSVRDKMSEFMFLGLRKTQGVSAKDFESRFGSTFYFEFNEPIKKYLDLGLLEKDGDFLRFTPKGLRLSNTVLCEFV